MLSDDLKREGPTLAILRGLGDRKSYSELELHARLTRLMQQTDESSFSPAEKSKRLVADALLSGDEAEQKRKATEALKRDAGCAEAYIVLARLESDLSRQLEILETGLKLAESQIDKSKFDDPDGYFWRRLVTRPYMRCKMAIAETLWKHGESDKAIDHLKALLRLNPYDNQGIRYRLLNWSLELSPVDDTSDKLFEEYEREESAFGKYALLLWRFAKSGDSRETKKALKLALKSNKFVPALICGTASNPDYKITRVVRGTPQEAFAYTRIGGRAWSTVYGAKGWLLNACSTLVNSKTTIRKIESAVPQTFNGAWASEPPAELADFLIG